MNKLTTWQDVARQQLNRVERELQPRFTYAHWRMELDVRVAMKRMAWLLTMGRPGGYNGPLAIPLPQPRRR